MIKLIAKLQRPDLLFVVVRPLMVVFIFSELHLQIPVHHL